MTTTPRVIKPKTIEIPSHLSESTATWFRTITETFVLDDHHVRLLTLACESWDRGVQARVALAEHGLTFEDKNGNPRTRPEVAIERDSRLAFARLVRELALDDTPPPDSRIPRLGGRR